MMITIYGLLEHLLCQKCLDSQQQYMAKNETQQDV